VYRDAVFACRHQPLTVAPDVERALAAAYGEPHRAYHTAAHIAEVLRWFDVVADAVGWQHPADVYVAILFHDAIYDPLAKDNEARSADLARRLVAASDRSCELIRLTARHGSVDTADHDAALFLDCDTAILGAPAGEFDAYDADIAREYSVVPPEAYRAGRRAFLISLAARPRIFLSDFFHSRLDAAARANLARKLGTVSPVSTS
jgi:predicted metal-dependent HD superfamily phosphohydrolase